VIALLSLVYSLSFATGIDNGSAQTMIAPIGIVSLIVPFLLMGIIILSTLISLRGYRKTAFFFMASMTAFTFIFFANNNMSDSYNYKPSPESMML
jgi:hypothetical protein